MGCAAPWHACVLCNFRYTGRLVIHLSTCLWISQWTLLLSMKVVMPMIFLSTLLRQSIYDIEGRRLGVLRDVSVSLNETFPVVTALVVRSPLGNSQTDMIIPWYKVNSLDEPRVYIMVKLHQIASYTHHSDSLVLQCHIL